jgi:hypothetical protein
MSGWNNVLIHSITEMFGNRWVIDLPGGSQTPGAQIILYTQNNGVNQHRQLHDTGEHTNVGRYYYIISKASGQALTETATPGARVGARVFQEGLGHLDSQKWQINTTTPGDTFIVNKFSGLVLDIQGNNFQAGTPIITYPENPGGTVNQRWTIIAV